MVRFKQTIKLFLLSLTILMTIQPTFVAAMQPNQAAQPTPTQRLRAQKRSIKKEIITAIALFAITGLMFYLIKKIGFDAPENPNPNPNPNPVPQPQPQQAPQPRPAPQPAPKPNPKPAPVPKPTIPHEEKCAVCLKHPRKIGPEQIYTTTCCKRFICKNDIDRMEQDAHEWCLNYKNPEWRTNYSNLPDFAGWPTQEQQDRDHAACPVCRHYPLNAVKAHVASQPVPAPVISPTIPDTQNEQACNICMDDKPITDFTPLSCNHNTYCTDCLTTMVDNALREKNTQALQCPQCHQAMNENDVRNITHNNRNKLDAFQDITTQEWLMQQQDARHCPTPNCPFSFINEQQNPLKIKCPHCNREYCSNCLLNHDRHVSCTQAKEDYELTRNPTAAEKATAKWKQQNTKPCSWCGTPIERIAGCDSMFCKACKHYFCWACQQKLNRDHEGHQCSAYNAWIA